MSFQLLPCWASSSFSTSTPPPDQTPLCSAPASESALAPGAFVIQAPACPLAPLSSEAVCPSTNVLCAALPSLGLAKPHHNSHPALMPLALEASPALAPGPCGPCQTTLRALILFMYTSIFPAGRPSASSLRVGRPAQAAAQSRDGP